MCSSRRDWFVDLFWILNVKNRQRWSNVDVHVVVCGFKTQTCIFSVKKIYARDRGHYQTYTPVTSWNG